MKIRIAQTKVEVIYSTLSKIDGLSVTLHSPSCNGHHADISYGGKVFSMDLLIDANGWVLTIREFSPKKRYMRKFFPTKAEREISDLLRFNLLSKLDTPKI